MKTVTYKDYVDRDRYTDLNACLKLQLSWPVDKFLQILKLITFSIATACSCLRCEVRKLA